MSDRVEFDYMRVKTSHTVTFHLDDFNMAILLTILRSGVEVQLPRTRTPMTDAIERLRAAALAPIEPNHP